MTYSKSYRVLKDDEKRSAANKAIGGAIILVWMLFLVGVLTLALAHAFGAF